MPEEIPLTTSTKVNFTNVYPLVDADIFQVVKNGVVLNELVIPENKVCNLTLIISGDIENA